MKKKNYTKGLIGFVLLLSLGVIIFFREKDESVYAQNVDKIVEIDYEKQQEEIDKIVEEGTMNVNYSSKAVFKGTQSELFNVKNIKNNHYPIEFEIFDENGRCIYMSDKIEPGYEMNDIQLNEKLSKGSHACKIKIGYAEEGNVSSMFPLDIEVR